MHEFQYLYLLRADLAEVEARILEVTQTVPQPVDSALRIIVNSGGKRLRPALALLSAYICAAPMRQAITVAAGIEMLHTATLVHDDLIDDASLRRGHPTLNSYWSTPATVLAGDLVFARAALLASQGNNLSMIQSFSSTLEIICAGELSQFFAGRGNLPTFEEYEQRIFAKTGSLFALSMEVGPQLAGDPPDQIALFRRFGTLLGAAFQIADDVLDLVSDETVLGKPVGSDLRQGLATLPVLLYQEAHPEDTRILDWLHEPGNTGDLLGLIADLRDSGAIEAAMTIAEDHIHDALSIMDQLPPSPYRHAVEEIANFAVRRHY